ncbi:NAD(P)/FAD-dependent oxidoreductase [Agromyces aurantiacus]|uniref:NAD(P)/FAD-dependent oxidoreductase n=1 Tax=Agromyces aurantiacus TaxID=165814 RepID=A0ABV9R424_9MICO|nr:FAD-dependent oxidoreductase [Agromyces aurantiacus]MBM7503394.1 sulfide:quinone oxidoreductase [Agromyces aurantiacus]
MATNVLILGAGFGGLELATLLSERLQGEVEVTLVDQSETFFFGYSKLDVLMGRATPDEIRLPYARFSKPGVEFRRERVLEIDPATRRVVTDAAGYDPDVLVIALGAGYDPAATPGFAEGGFEYYTVEGAARLRDELAAFDGGRIMLAVLSIPFKCPPAPYEGALLLHELLVARGIREASSIRVVSPQPSPIPVSRSVSQALEQAMADRGIRYTSRHRVHGIDPGARVAHLADHDEPYDLFIGIPVHRVPDVLVGAGLTTDGWVAVDPATSETRFPGVYAIGDCVEAGVPKAGTLAEAAARVVASAIVRRVRGEGELERGGAGTCFVEFGADEVGRVEVDFGAPGGPRADLVGPSAAFAGDKAEFGAARRARWFGMDA